VIQIARHYFGAEFLPKTNIVESDAHTFLKKNSYKYDLIVIDLFYELEVPEKFCEIDFLNLTKNALDEKGLIYFNFVAENPQQKNRLKDLQTKFQSVFENSQSIKMSYGNHILTNAL
jgi:spermidine synthase